MRPLVLLATVCYLALACGLDAQTTYPYALKTIAGTNPTGDGGPATAALLEQPQAVAVDSSGQIYIAQGNTGGIRKVDKNGAISTVSTVYAADVKVDSAGNRSEERRVGKECRSRWS